MAKAKRKKIKPKAELDGVYILKIVLYIMVGAQWLRLTDAAQTRQIPLPIGLIVGAFFALHEHFQIDRKIEFAILLVACFVGFWSQTGVWVSVLR